MSAPDQPVNSQHRRQPPTLAFVVPCYNEQEALPTLIERLSSLSADLVKLQLIDSPATLILVDDGSTDNTWNVIEKSAQHHPIQGIKLSRNHGHQAALLAGLMRAKTDVIISLDADLQDDVGVISDMVTAYLTGAEIVFGVRDNREADSHFKRLTARAYYRLLLAMGVQIIPDHADFRLMSRKALESLREYSEVNLFLRGLVVNLGYETATVTYTRQERVAGESKYPLGKMISLALDGVTSFSTKPLRVITYLGFAMASLSFAYIVYAVIGRIMGVTVLGWTSLVVSIFMLGGVQLIALGIIGEYLGKIYLETKRRPQFIIDQEIAVETITKTAKQTS